MTASARVQAESLRALPDPLDAVIEALLLSLLVFSPLALGVVEAWSELVVISLSGGLALGLGLKFLLRPDAKPVLSWAYVPLALFLLLAVFQLCPLPVGLVSLLSPHTAEIKNTLLADLPPASTAGGMTLSFYPGGTMHELRLALAVAVVFLASVHLYRQPAPVRRLLAVISVLGAGIAILAIAQIVTGAEKIYWLVSISTDNANGGTFVNRNNFCQFMNLALGASLALLLLKFNDGLSGVKKTLPNVLDWVTSSSARWVWLLVGAMVVGMASIFLSLSRGGVVSLLLAGTLVTAIMTLRQRVGGRGWIMVGLMLCAFVCVLFLGFDAVFDRLATLEQRHAYLGRWGILQGVLLAWTRFPLLGAGFGTHEVVYPMFDRTTTPTLATFAENEYAQTAEETGLVGLLLVAAFTAAVWMSCRRCLRAGGWQASVGLGLSFALLAVLVHSLGDFGLHFPANGCLAAASCGVLVGLASVGRSPETSRSARVARRVLAPLGVVTAVAVMGWAVFTAHQARAAENHSKQALAMEAWLVERDWQGRNEDYVELIHHAAQAAEQHPSKIDYAYLLGLYRWRSISRVEDPETGRITLTGEGLEFLRRIVRELHAARVTCPTYGPLYSLVGQLEWFFPDEADGEIGKLHIRQGFELAPHDANVCFFAGLLDVEEGQPHAALEKLERALALNERLFTDLADVLLIDERNADLVLKLAGADAGRLLLVADKLAESGRFQVRAEQVRRQAIVLLKEQCRAADAPAGVLASVGRLYRLEEDYAAAREYYVRALEANYGQVDWRLELARIYLALGQTEEAINQARVCLRLRPQLEAATKIIRDRSSSEGS